MDESEFAGMIKDAGGRLYIAGGWVRDRIRGAAPHDKDYVVAGLAEDTFRSLSGARRIGASFPVYRAEIGGELCDVALARGERKTGLGYRGFEAASSPHTTIEEDLERRDTTMNSIALDVETGEIIDPFGGVADIGNRIIRAASSRFADDPVRALRAARQAAQFDFSIERATIGMMGSLRGEIMGEPGERIAGELKRAMSCGRPSIFFRALLDAGILDAVYPQVYALKGLPHLPEHHPEGDAFEHSMRVLDDVARMTGRAEVRFAALAHDLGKALTPIDERPHYYGHERLGLDALSEWNRLMTLPRRWTLCAKFAIEEHMRAWSITRPGKIVDLLNRLRGHPIGPDGFSAIVLADSGALPEFLENFQGYCEVLDRVTRSAAPPGMEGAALGEWIRRRRIDEYRMFAPPGETSRPNRFQSTHRRYTGRS
ncbi:MAG: HD domain-containing protein [Synergistaceae bacterium]|nr:HD domain-containing protein [Synergistaceae bacterium]